MYKKINMMFVVLGILLLGACSSSDEETEVREPNVEDVVEDNATTENDPDAEYEALLEEADEFAEEVRKAFATNDFHKIAELGTDKTLENIKGYGIDLEEGATERHRFKYYEDALDFAGDYYSLYRLEDLYDEEEGHFWYGTIYMRIGSAMREKIEEIETEEEKINFLEYNLITSTKVNGRDRKVFVIKKDDDGEWVLGTFLDRLSNFKSLNLSDEERERILDNKTYIHELPEVEEDNSLF